MFEQVADNLFLLRLSMGFRNISFTNCYLIKGQGRSLLVDTGSYSEDNLRLMQQSLADLGVEPEQLDIFLTHTHDDHVGLLEDLATAGSRVFCSAADWRMLLAASSPQFVAEMEERFRSNGWPDGLPGLFALTPPLVLRDPAAIHYHPAQAGMLFSYGSSQWRCLTAAGHTQGQLALYDSRRGLLLAGDLVVDSIFPNLFLRHPWPEALPQVTAALLQPQMSQAKLIYSGHGRPISQAAGRCRITADYYRQVFDSTLAQVGAMAQTAYQLAAAAQGAAWADLPPRRRWIFVGQMICGLEYWQQQGLVRSTSQQGLIAYCRS